MWREHGFKIAFILYWSVYLPILIIYTFHFVFDPRVIMSIGDTSYAILPVVCVITFLKCKVEDYNLDYFGACVASFITRVLVTFLKYWGLRDPSWVLIFTVSCMFIYWCWLKYSNYQRSRYFRY